MTPEELLEHEKAMWQYIAECKLIGSWQAKLKGKRLTVIVYRIKPEPDKDPRYHRLARKVRNRIAISYGRRMLVSQDLEP